MRFRGLSRYAHFLIAGALLAVLAVLAVHQYHWIHNVSELHRERMRRDLRSTGIRFTRDFNREVTRAFLYFHPDFAERTPWRELAARQLERWRTEAPYPRLVRDVFAVRRTDSGELILEALVSDAPEGGRFRDIPWPADLEPLRRRLSDGHSHFDMTSPVSADVPGLVVPLPFQPFEPAGGGAFIREGKHRWNEYLVVRLDTGVIAGEILPALTTEHFGSPRGVDYAVAVVATDNPARVIYRSDPSLPAAAFRTGDMQLGLLAVGPFEELRRLLPRTRGERGEGHPGHIRRHFRIQVDPPSAPDAPDVEGVEGREPRRAAGWQLVIRHRNGTLEDAVARVRRTQMAAGAGMLALLGVTSVLLVIATQRTQALARQQIEFVAGVSHELRTPLTAIRSAGQNLADGVVTDPSQVKRYGVLIASEGRRLSNMVGQVMEFAGFQSNHKNYELQPTAVADVLEGALEESRWLLEERHAQVEKDIAAGLPPVLADAPALRRAVGNLLENAAKYGGRPPRIGVRARTEGREVEVTVEDHGPGIGKEDLPRLFEPFYRGRNGSTRGIPGSGLGLSIVRHIAEAHRGRVSVTTNPGQGSAFTLHLPAAPGEEAA
ncbi:MAG TPA: HAMP domain-containing sensor histidine kinase [Thermoanaerobaculia bacterium]|nr:HAMP domain-containing sensor histidine kinase [Thermoanaerobaculia bacterium]